MLLPEQGPAPLTMGHPGSRALHPGQRRRGHPHSPHSWDLLHRHLHRSGSSGDTNVLALGSVGGGRWRKVWNCVGVSFLAAARSSCWIEKGAPYGVHVPCVEGLPENWTGEGTPYAVGVRVDWGC